LSGEELGISAFFSQFRGLTDSTYKICTSLSTGFVDNAVPAARLAQPEAAPGADFRAARHRP
jgi:hypothetical protein